MKKILILTDGNIDHASSRIRAIQYIPLLEKEGFKVKWIARVPIKNNAFFGLLFFIKKRLLTLNRVYLIVFTKYEVIFIQRIFISKSLLLIIKKIKKSKIIYDFDDAIYLNEKDTYKTNNILKYSNHVIVSNNNLNNYVENYNLNSTIITTPIDTDKFIPNWSQSMQNTLNIGWIGSSWTTKYLELVIEPLRRLSKQYDIKLTLIGAALSFKPNGINIEHKEWSINNEHIHIQDFDIGIMPLTSDKFAEGKGGYKILQYMSCGKPSIASPIGINANIIIEEYNGFLASNTEEWYNKILYFIKNKDQIINFGVNARKCAEEKYSRSICFEKLIQILK